MPRNRIIGVVLALVVIAGGCGSDDPGEPVGQPVLPDLVPLPPVELNLNNEDGTSILRFSSVLVNAGEGDFLLRGSRVDGVWTIKQEIRHSESGGTVKTVDADLMWGGDGHEHWHISRVATYWLVALNENGEPIPEVLGVDTKIGFCFYDSAQELDQGPEEAVYSSHDCGHEDDTTIRMGLSTGWADIYSWALPGQSVDITDLPDGGYRLWAEADTAGWFEERSRSNNLTWADIDIYTEDGLRWASVVGTGPTP